jgi:hypothetical protein
MIQIISGKDVWKSSAYTLADRNFRWSADGQWLHVDIVSGSGENATVGTLSINVKTHQVIEPPYPDAQFVSESPDQQWWLFARVREWGSDTPDTLFAYAPATGKTEILVENVKLSQRNFHFDPRSYYVWSPIF